MAKTNTTAKVSKKRIKFTMPNALTVLLLVVAFAVFLTWVIPSMVQVKTVEGKETSDFANAGIVAFGIFDIFASVGAGFADAAGLIFFLFTFGAFLQIIISSGSMEAGIGSLVKKMNGKEIFMIPILMIFFSIGGTVYGMGEETPPFYIILVPVLILAGFDAMTGTLTVLLGAAVGVMASTINPFMIGAAAGAAETSVGNGMGFRFLAWFILTGLTIAFVTWYAFKSKRNPKKSVLSESERKEHTKWANDTYHLEDLPKFTRRRKILIGVLFASIATLIVFMVPWNDLLFAPGSGDEISTPPGFISRLLAPLGKMYFLECAFLFLFLAIICAMIAGYNEKKMINEFMIGSKDMMGVALVITVARGVSIILAGSDEYSNVLVTWDPTSGINEKGSITLSSNISSVIDLLKADITKHGLDLKWIDNVAVLDKTQFDNASLYLNKLRDVNDGSSIIIGDAKALESLSLKISGNTSISNTLLSGMSSGLNGVDKIGIGPLIMLIQTPMAFLIPSTSGLSGISMPIFAPVADGIGGAEAIAHTINGTSFALGNVNVFTPSSGILMVGLSLGRIEYSKYLKLAGPFIAFLYVVGMLLLLMPSF